MRLAVHSIVWGEEADLNQMLADIRKAGFLGVELFQHPGRLGGAAGVRQLFDRHGLQLIGLCAGTLAFKKEFVDGWCRLHRIYRDQPAAPYLYVDEWDDACVKAVNEGYRLGLHPHMYRPVQTLQEVERLLQLHPRLRFIPDTAHLTIAGEEPTEGIKRSFARIDAIHLKDWKANVGRSYQFYARGFCELGMGDIELEKVLTLLAARRFEGWVVVEQDSSDDPGRSAQLSADWLRGWLAAAGITDAAAPRGWFQAGAGT
jgi:sugar phosphate isomerase/epimerase